MYRYVLRLTGDQAQSEDVLQETFITMFSKFDSWRGEGSVRAWLFAIARNEVLKARRRRVGEPEAFESTEEDESLVDLGAAAGWGEAMNPEVFAQRTEAQAQLEAALDSLDPEAREVLVLRELHGLSGEETAQVLGLGVPAMKSRLHRARLQLVAAVKRAN